MVALSYDTVVCYGIIGLTGFDYNEFTLALSYAVPAAAVMGGVSLMIELLNAIWE